MAMADWTPETVVSRSSTTAEIETFMNDVSMTKTNIAIARRRPSRGVPVSSEDIGREYPVERGTSPGRWRPRVHRCDEQEISHPQDRPSGSRPSASACSDQRRKDKRRTGRPQKRSCLPAGCPPWPGQRTRRPASFWEVASSLDATLYCRMANGLSGGGGVLERILRDPCLECGSQPVAEAVAIELGELGLAQRLGVDPLNEERDVDLGLSVRDVLRASRLDPARGRLHLELRLLRVPARGLVSGPSRRDRRHREQHRREDVDPVLRVGCGRCLGSAHWPRWRVAGRLRRRARRPSHRSGGARRQGSRGPAPSPQDSGCRARRGMGRRGTG